jgi:hypothetical protein
VQARTRLAAATTFAASTLVFGVACVDLFHSTDFATLCTYDAAACISDSGDGATDADISDGRDEATAAPIDFCKGSPSEARRLAEHACGYLGACLGTTESASFGACMLRALAAYDCSFNPSLRPRGATAVLWQCLSKVSSCDDTALCVFGTKAPSCPGRTGPNTFTACNLDNGSVLVECGDPKTAIGMEACALSGRTCARVDKTKSICAGARGVACTVSPRCEGTSAVECKSAGGIESDEGLDCAAYGDGRCALDDAGAACVPLATAPPCSGSSNVVCSDGGAFVASCVGGRTVKIDCSAIGQGCNADGVSTIDPARACKNLDAGTVCSPMEDECSSGVLRSCAQGTLFELPCTSVPGLGACAKRNGRRATCTAP